MGGPRISTLKVDNAATGGGCSRGLEKAAPRRSLSELFPSNLEDSLTGSAPHHYPRSRPNLGARNPGPSTDLVWLSRGRPTRSRRRLTVLRLGARPLHEGHAHDEEYLPCGAGATSCGAHSAAAGSVPRRPGRRKPALAEDDRSNTMQATKPHRNPQQHGRGRLGIPALLLPLHLRASTTTLALVVLRPHDLRSNALHPVGAPSDVPASIQVHGASSEQASQESHFRASGFRRLQHAQTYHRPRPASDSHSHIGEPPHAPPLRP